MKKRILVCGSTGFIGRNISEALSGRSDLEVYGTYFKSKPLNNANLRMIRADLTDKDDVAKAVNGMNVVIQAAAVTSGAKDILERPHVHVTDNALMNALLFRAAFDCKISHLIFLSCTTMYHSSDVPLKEGDFDASKEICPDYFGGAWTKIYNEKMCEFYSRLGPTKYTVIRHSNIYGPYDKYEIERSHVFGATVAKIMTARSGEKIMVWGKGEEERDLLYISDLVNFVEDVLNRQSSSFELFNVGYGSSISVTQLVEKIIKHSGRNVGFEYDPSKPSIKTRLCLDTTKARNFSGWTPKISLDEGIKKTLGWYRDYFKVTRIL